MAIPHSQTFIYKTASSCPIKLNLYLPPSPKDLPILLWFHGGGLLQGMRTSVAPHMLAGVRSFPYALVSADHRLAPQVGVAEILTDVIDCVTFIRNELPAKVETGVLDTSKLVVSGSSAGGYLALLAGLYVQPKVDAVLAIYPITDPWGKFFTTPQFHPEGRLDRAVVAEYLDRSAAIVSENPRDSTRNKMYHFMMQEAILASLLNVKKEDEKFMITKALLKHGKDGLPPIFVVHGDKDQFVGVEQADEVVDVLKGMGAVVEYERPEGLDHLFDKDEKVSMEGMYAFMKSHL